MGRGAIRQAPEERAKAWAKAKAGRPGGPRRGQPGRCGTRRAHRGSGRRGTRRGPRPSAASGRQGPRGGRPGWRPGCDAGLHVAELARARLHIGDQVRRAGHHRVREDGRLLAEVRVGGAQEPVEVHVADDRDGRCGIASGPREPLQQLAVGPCVALAGVLLEDEMHARQRAVQDTLEHVDEVRAAHEGRRHARDHQQAVSAPHPELRPHGLPLGGAIARRRRGPVQVETRRSRDGDLVLSVAHAQEDPPLVVAEDEGDVGQHEVRMASSRVAGMGRIQDPVLDGIGPRRRPAAPRPATRSGGAPGS